MPRKPIEDVTDRQVEVIRAIDRFVGQNGFPPSMKELAAILSIAPASVHERVVHLVNKGYLAKAPGKARSLVVKKRPSGSE